MVDIGEVLRWTEEYIDLGDGLVYIQLPDFQQSRVLFLYCKNERKW